MHALSQVEAGKTVAVPVYVKIPKGGKVQPVPTNLTFTSTSATDANKSASMTRPVCPGNGK
ncbi:hypothetical protein [Neobacillus soli]|uniref:hypothetical protein n=1 Tax=Neobacillus soli TaxID=220688 RepID=UPI0008249909|nr:hypothetical protein [Neobacillus soli]